MNYCAICGNYLTEEHHLIFGRAHRKPSDEDKLTMRLCHNCHMWIHSDGRAGTLSKMLGQMIYENKNGTREDFIKRYGRIWLE